MFFRSIALVFPAPAGAGNTKTYPPALPGDIALISSCR